MLIICSNCSKIITSAHNRRATVKHRLCFKCQRIENRKSERLHQEAEAEKERLLRVFKPK